MFYCFFLKLVGLNAISNIFAMEKYSNGLFRLGTWKRFAVDEVVKLSGAISSLTVFNMMSHISLQAFPSELHGIFSA